MVGCDGRELSWDEGSLQSSVVGDGIRKKECERVLAEDNHLHAVETPD